MGSEADIAIGAGQFVGYSAGSHPTGKVNSWAFEILRRMDFSIEGYRSKDRRRCGGALCTHAPRPARTIVVKCACAALTCDRIGSPQLARVLTAMSLSVISASPETHRRLPPGLRGGILQADWPYKALQPTPWIAVAFPSLLVRSV